KGWIRFKFAGEGEDPDLPELYLRPGAIVPTGPVMQYVDEKPLDRIQLLVALDSDGRASGTLYEDAAEDDGFQRGEYRLTTFTVSRREGKISWSSSSEGRWLVPPERKVEIVLVEARN